jgi:hypothetical protein
MDRFWRNLTTWESIDPRWLYLALTVFIVVPLFVDTGVPIPVSPETRKAYEAIENSPKEKLILIESDWDQGGQGENLGQCEALMEHCFRTNRRFAIISLIVTGPPFSQAVADRLAAKYNKKYGVDYVNWGYKITTDQAFQSLSRNIPRFIGADFRNTPVTDLKRLPIMRWVNDITDVGLVASIGYNPIMQWVTLVQGVYGTRYIPACASINSTGMYPFLNTGQLSGMLVGVRGAAEYEILLQNPGTGTRLIKAHALGHLMLILGVVVGNIGYLAKRRVRREAEDG